MRHRVINRPMLACVALIMVAGSGVSAVHAGPNDTPSFPGLGMYENLLAGICGKRRIDESPAAIPEIGCFAVRAGASLDGKINGRLISIRLDVDANETLYVDDIEIRRTGAGSTNDPLVMPTGTGFALCAAPADCPVRLDTMTREPGEFAVFDLARQFKPRSFVTNQENWDAQQLNAPRPKP